MPNTQSKIRFTYAVDAQEAAHFFETDDDYATLEECLTWRSYQDNPEQYPVFKSERGVMSQLQVIPACACCEMNKAAVLEERAIMHTPGSVCCGEVA